MKIKPLSAFVLISVELGRESEVIDMLEHMTGIRDVYFVLSVYDIVVKVEAVTLEELKEIITWRIRKLRGVKSIQTMIVME